MKENIKCAVKYNPAISAWEVDPAYTIDAIQTLIEENAKSIRIITLNGNIGERINLDFSFLKTLKSIECLRINDDFCVNKVIGIDIIKNIGLTSLDLLQPLEIDVSEIANLKSLKFKYSPSVQGLSRCYNLEELLISSIIGAKDLSFLSTLSSLKRLTISGSIESLNGIEQLIKLKSLKINHCSKLSNLSDLNQLSSLENLTIENCKRIIDWGNLKSCSISQLNVDVINTLSFLKHMPNLKAIKFLKCIDGNLNHLLEHKGLEKISFHPNMKHYTHNKEFILNSTGAKGAVGGNW